jgi:hypothetical protein
MGRKFIGDRLLCSAGIYFDVRNSERYEDRKRETGFQKEGSRNKAFRLTSLEKKEEDNSVRVGSSHAKRELQPFSRTAEYCRSWR